MLLPEGLNPGAYTPFTADNRLNANLLADELRRVVKGSGGLHGPALHSEYASLTFDEWKIWTDVLIDVARGAGIQAWPFFGAENLQKTMPYAEYAKKAGADGFFLVTPYFNKYSQDAVYRYYQAFARIFPDTPIIFYPSDVTGNEVKPATIARIAELPNIVGMKLSPDDSFEAISRIILLTKDNPEFRWVAGGLNVLYPLMKGVDIRSSCSSMSNFSHEWSLNFWNAYLAKDWPEVEKWDRKLKRIAAVLSVSEDRNFGARAGHKAALELMGRPVGPPRDPGVPATADHIARIKKVFQEEGLL